MNSDSNHENVLKELVCLLKLEKIKENIFKGKSQDLGFGSIFGGQVLGQSLSAATQTVDDDRPVHSMHAYFLLAGDPEFPIEYKVENLRDGRSFSTRQVSAAQKGRIIFCMSASFHVKEKGFDHQSTMPDVPGPENLMSDLEYVKKAKDKIPESIRDKLLRDKPVEIRQVSPVNPFKPQKKEPLKYSWFKACGILPDDLSIHRCLLAYASDFGLLATSLHPHAHTFWERQMTAASLDHSIWFHRDFRMDDWLLYSMESPSACSSRGLNRGQIFTKDGILVASTVQEGLMRYDGRE